MRECLYDAPLFSDGERKIKGVKEVAHGDAATVVAEEDRGKRKAAGVGATRDVRFRFDSRKNRFFRSKIESFRQKIDFSNRLSTDRFF